MTELKTVREVLEKFGDRTLRYESHAGWIMQEALQDISRIMSTVVGEDDEPRNTIEHNRRNFLRAEQRVSLSKALGDSNGD